MNLLHRYLFRQVLFATVVAMAMFAFVLLAGTVVKDVFTLVAEGRLTLTQATTMLVTYLPFVVPYSLPIGLLTGILLTFGRVSAQHEITAMRTAGVGLLRIGAPVMLVAVLGTAVALVVNFSYAPTAKAKYRALLFEAVQQNPMSLILPGTFVREFSGAVVYAAEREGDVLRDVWAWKLDREHRVTLFVRAAEGRLQWSDEHLEVAMFDAAVQERDSRDPENFSKGEATSFARTFPFRVELDQMFKRRTLEVKVGWMDLRQLLDERQRVRGRDDEASRRRLLEVEMSMHERASFAFSALSFAIIGVPLGIRTRRKETSANFGIALLLTLLFYVGMLSVQWMSDRPALHPQLMQWLPNLAFQAYGGWLWWRFGRN